MACELQQIYSMSSIRQSYLLPIPSPALHENLPNIIIQQLRIGERRTLKASAKAQLPSIEIAEHNKEADAFVNYTVRTEFSLQKLPPVLMGAE